MVLSVFWVLHVSAQCEVMDADGNGMINGSDMLYPLGAMGIENHPADLDSTGVVDILDVMTFLLYLGHPCPLEPIVPIAGLIEELVLETHHVHDEAMEEIPAGSVTYRLYARMSQAAAQGTHIHGIFGRNDFPLEVTSPNGFYVHFAAGSTTAENLNPIFFEVMPSAAFSSWWTLYSTPEMFQYSSDGFPLSYIEGENGSWNWEDEVGGGVSGFWFSPELPSATLDSSLVLLGQFTTLATEDITGSINLVAKTPDFEVEYATGLTFNSSQAVASGCMDEAALNFNSAAVIPTDICQYLGDLNGDGIVDITDLLALLGAFGCTECTDTDLNGDGVVSVQDVLILLEAWGLGG